jgi:hypothetical protein
MYCLRCKIRTETPNEVDKILSNGRHAKSGTCVVCGRKKYQILKSGGSILNTMLNKLQLPEMHLSLHSAIQFEVVPNGSFQNTGKYSYCRPFTKLDKRLAQGYRGVNQLDKACLNHDIAYSKNSDTASRNMADDVLAAAASQTTLGDAPENEKKSARTVSAIMSAKSRFGLGNKLCK